MEQANRLRKPLAGVAAAVALAVWLLGGGPGAAHEAEQGPAPQGDAEAAGPSAPFPFEIGGPFELTDHRGREVTDQDFRGSHMLVFFGYTNCERICPVGLERMVEALDLLGEAGAGVQPLLITVDPARDTVEALAAYVAKIHPRLIGLTGTPEQLAAAAKAYRVESEEVGKSWKGGPVIAHGSYITLMGPDGRFATLLPPVLDSAAMAETIRKYL
jgi:protein SCO1/2